MSQAAAAPRAPYKLFDYYTFADRDLFFGREEEVLRTVGEVLSTRLLVLFAPSGSGKSSLINAGVRPKLEERGLATITVRLDCAPELAIKKRLREKFPEVFGSLSHDTDLVAGLRAAYAAKDGQPAPKPLVLFLDQFEEFFIVWRDQPEVRRAFIKQVAQIKFDTSLPVYLVLSLRDDYFVRLNEFREEIPSIFHNNANIQLRPLDDAAALRAIVEPARICELEFEPGLPEQIIRDLKALDREKATERGVHAASAPNSNGAASAERKPEATEPGSGLKAALPDATDIGVLPITLQIVCHKLWEKRPAEGQPVTRKLYGGDQQDGGLGGAAAIIRRQLDESLQQIPRSEYGLMRKLFRVLMTADLTKRLRSLDDLAELLRLRDREKLKALLENLTAVSVLREEHSERLAWYEFRHDYLVKEVSAWLERFEARLRRRRQAYAWGLGVLPTMILAGLALWNFLSLEVRFTPKQYSEQEEELHITRRFNPFDFHVTTGFRKDEVTDLQRRNEVAGGYPLRFTHPLDWRPLTNLLSGFNAAWLGFISDPQPALYPELVAAIGDSWGVKDDTDLNSAAILARKEPSLVSPLLRCLQSTNAAVRLNGVGVFQRLGTTNESVMAGLTALLTDSNSTVRQRATAALGHLGRADAPLSDALLAMLRDSDQDVRERAAEALLQVGNGDALVIARLLELLNDSAWPVRESAAKALGQLGKGNSAVVQGLLVLLKESEWPVCQSAVTALVQLGSADASVTTGLLTLLADNNPPVRQNAAEALGLLGKGDTPVVNGLSALLYDTDWHVRRRAAVALGLLGQCDTAVVQGLLDLVRDGEGTDANYQVVFKSVAGVLDPIGKDSTSLVEGLLAMLRDNRPVLYPGFRQRAADALSQLGQGGVPVTKELLTLLTHIDPFVRQVAAGALGRLGNVDAPVVEGLLPLLHDSDPGVRMGAAAALGQVGQGDASVAAALFVLLNDEAPGYGENVRLCSAEALVQLGQKDARLVEVLIALLKDSFFPTRQRSAAALLRLGKADLPVLDALLAVLDDNQAIVRRSAAEALGKLGQNRASWTDERLLEMLQDNLSGWRQTAGLVLANRTNLTQATYDQVMALRLDSRPWVRLAAWDALLEIQQVRDAREQAAKAVQPAPPAQPPQ
jgi:HEAT repeat protein